MVFIEILQLDCVNIQSLKKETMINILVEHFRVDSCPAEVKGDHSNYLINREYTITTLLYSSRVIMDGSVLHVHKTY